MADVAIVTDTTHYLPAELAARYELHEVDLYVSWAGAQHAEHTLAGRLEEYYASIAREEQLPTTSQPSIGDFLTVWRPLLEAGRDVVSVHISAALSGTVEAARAARAQLESEGAGGDRGTVIDSRVTCGALGWAAICASATARAGGDTRAVVAAIERARPAIDFRFTLDTLEHLQRGGRIGPVQRWAGSALQIKPILSLDGGFEPVERVRTTRRALQRMDEHLRARQEAGDDGWAVQHSHAPERAEELLARGREIFGCEPLFCSEIGPVIGAHVGPGLWGVGGLRMSLLDP